MADRKRWESLTWRHMANSGWKHMSHVKTHHSFQSSIPSRRNLYVSLCVCMSSYIKTVYILNEYTVLYPFHLILHFNYLCILEHIWQHIFTFMIYSCIKYFLIVRYLGCLKFGAVISKAGIYCEIVL